MRHRNSDIETKSCIMADRERENIEIDWHTVRCTERDVWTKIK